MSAQPIAATSVLQLRRSSNLRFGNFRSLGHGGPPGLGHRAADIAYGHVAQGAGMGGRRVSSHHTGAPASGAQVWLLDYGP
jgi:hypothetical protein